MSSMSMSGLLSLSFARRKAVIPPTPIVPPATTITSTALVPVIRFPVIRHTSRRNTALTLESIATFANTYSTTNGAKLLHALYSSNRGVVNSVLIFSTPSEQLYPFDLMVHSNEFLAAWSAYFFTRNPADFISSLGRSYKALK